MKGTLQELATLVVKSLLPIANIEECIDVLAEGRRRQT
jgi:hypothetical protein